MLEGMDYLRLVYLPCANRGQDTLGTEKSSPASRPEAAI